MRHSQKNSSFLIALFVFSGVGCGSTDLSDVALPIPDATETAAGGQKKASIVASSNNLVSLSPAEKPNQMPEPDASPAEVCQKFLFSLNREDSDRFELLLTSAAQSIASRHDFRLPPVAEPSAAIRLGQPKFATNREDICYIDCEVVDAIGVSTTENQMTWLLRKTKSGWRIAGMLVPAKQAKESASELMNLLSFESATDIAQIKESLVSEDNPMTDVSSN